MVTACGDEGDAEPGTELGPCLDGQFCESPLRCVGDLCVHPDQLDDTGSASAEDGSPSTSVGSASVTSVGEASMTGADGTTVTTGEPTPEIHCTNDGIGCICSHNADWGPTGVACSAATLMPPASCCASEGWPAYGGCSCWSLTCRMLSYDHCYCGPGLPDGMEQPVATCVPPPAGGGTGGAGICCRDPGLGTCSCWTDLTQCLEGSEQVASCSAEVIGCDEGDAAVAACN